MEQNTVITMLDMENSQIPLEYMNHIEKLVVRNTNLLTLLEGEACRLLKLGRAVEGEKLLSIEGESQFAKLPLEIREYIAINADNSYLLTNERKRFILNYAQNKMGFAGSRSNFFKMSQCDKVMKKIDLIPKEILMNAYPVSLADNRYEDSQDYKMLDRMNQAKKNVRKNDKCIIG